MRTARLSDVCKIVNGGTPKSGVPEYWGGDVAWLTPAEMGKRSSPYVAGTARSITRTGLANCSARQVPVGAVILSTRAPIGHLAIPEVPMAFNQGCRGLIPGDALDTKFLYYFLWFSRDALNDLGTGATFKELSSGALGNYTIPIPPLEEQRRIVAVLDEAFAAIAAATANAEKNLANARELFEQASSELLAGEGDDWRVHSLEEVCTISSKLVDPKLIEFIDLPHIGAGNIESCTGELSNVLTAREEGLISGKFIFDPTMVLYSKIRPYLMKACRPDFAGLCSADVYPLAPKDEKLHRDFLFHVLLSKDFTAYAEAGSARAGMPKVNRDHLFAYRFKAPPVGKQQEIASRIDALATHCRDLADCLKRKLKEMEALKQSLLQRAFSGAPVERVSLAA